MAAFLCGEDARARYINKKQKCAILAQTRDRNKDRSTYASVFCGLKNFDVVAGEHVAALLLGAVGFRCTSDFAGEYIDKAARGAIADFVGDFRNGFSAVCQQSLGFFQAGVDDVLGRRIAGLLFK